MEIIKVLAKILTNILTALYEPFGFSILLSFLAMFFYLYAYEPQEAGKGWKSAIVTWYQKFKESVCFRKLFLLAFVTSLVLFRTLLNRNLWMNPLSDVMGGNGWKKILWQSGKVAFGFSLMIEMLQLLLRLGTFQLSDIFYNTVGGVLGGVCYCGIKKVIQKI